MKKLSAILLIAMFSVPAFSQFLSFGIKAGTELNTTPEYKLLARSPIPTGPTIPNLTIHADNTSLGFHGGIFTRVKIFNLYVQPEVLFASTSYNYGLGHKRNQGGRPVSQRFNKLSVPLLVGLKLGPLRVNAGPAANVLIGTPKALDEDIPNFKNMYKNAVWGYQAGVGIDILKKITLDARYAGSLGERYGDTVTIWGENFKLDHGQKSFLLSVGLMF